jgi:hypothetical protein
MRWLLKEAGRKRFRKDPQTGHVMRKKKAGLAPWPGVADVASDVDAADDIDVADGARSRSRSPRPARARAKWNR